MTNKTLWLPLITLLGLLFTVGCNGSESGSESGSENHHPLAGTSWILESYGPTEAPITPLPDNQITAEFNEGHMEGSAGCNGYSAPYQINENMFTLGEFNQTLMGCEPEEIMQQESAFSKALIEADSFTLDGETLTMSYPNGVLRFTAKSEATDLSLEGMVWQLHTFIEGDTALSLLADTEITAQLTNNKINGSAGCNDYFGGYERNGEQITFLEMGTTRKGCPNEIMEQEQRYFTHLQNAERITIDGDTLTISHANGELIFKAN